MEFCLCSKYGMLQSKTPLQGGPGVLPQKNLKFETLIGDLQHAVFGELFLARHWHSDLHYNSASRFLQSTGF